MLGRLLCKLGVHDCQLGGWNQPADEPIPLSTWGGCVRTGCRFGWQWDN